MSGASVAAVCHAPREPYLINKLAIGAARHCYLAACEWIENLGGRRLGL
jgi:hypothetical protein